jgi:hypothetical protein
MDRRWEERLRADGIWLADNHSLLGKAIAELTGLRIEAIRLLELLGAGTLRQVAGDRHQVGPDRFDRFNERLGQ